MLERTFCMIKPDGLSRGLKEKIRDRIKKAGFKVIDEKELLIGRDQAERLYAVHQGQPFYPGLVNFITSGPVQMMILGREDAVAQLRQLMGATDPRAAAPGTIRGDLKEENIFNPEGIMKNVVHGSDSAENAQYEISIFF